MESWHFYRVLATCLLWLCTIPRTTQTDTTSGFYADNDLQQTEKLAPLPTRQRREIKQEILTLLGLHHKPKPFLPVEESSAPRYMLDLYNVLQNEGNVLSRDDERRMVYVNTTTLNAKVTIKEADMVMSFLNHATKKNGITQDRSKRYFFDFKDVPVTEVVIGAELRIYKRPSKSNDANDPFTFELFRMDHGQDLEERQLVPVATTTVVHEEEGWITFNVTSAAAYWTAFPANNLGLYLQITDRDGEEMKPHQIGIVGRHGPDARQPFLVTFFKNEQQIHVRRTREARARKKEKEYAESSDVMYADDPGYSFPQTSRRVCQRRTLYVNFKDLGWQEWIIAPKGYAAYFCSGQCSFPLNAHMNATNHAIVQTLVHLMNPGKIPLPCCAPTTLSAISVLYFDDGNNVVLKKFNDIVVRACGCH